MYSLDILKNHIIIFRYCGFWPDEKSSWLYVCWSIIYTAIVCICFPISQLVCVFFVDSVDAIVDHLLLTSTLIMASVKGINVMVQKRKLVQLFNTLNAMDENVAVENRKYEEIFQPIMKNSQQLNKICFGAYLSSWIILVMQVIFSSADKRGGGWSSTHFYPSAFLRQQSIYVNGLFYQAASNLLIIVMVGAADTYPIILLNILSGHIDVLKIQLQEFDASEELKNDSNVYRSLVRFCETYKNVLKYDNWHLCNLARDNYIDQ